MMRTSCPWSKELWLDGPSLLRHFIEAEELRELLKVAQLKQIHLRDVPAFVTVDGGEDVDMGGEPSAGQ